MTKFFVFGTRCFGLSSLAHPSYPNAGSPALFSIMSLSSLLTDRSLLLTTSLRSFVSTRSARAFFLSPRRSGSALLLSRKNSAPQ